MDRLLLFTLFAHMISTGQHTGLNLFKLTKFDTRIHILYWLIIVAFWPLITFLIEGEIWDPLVNKLGYLPSQMLVSYVFIYYLLPLLFRRQLFWFFNGLFLITYAATVLARVMKIYFYETLVGYESQKESLVEILTHQGPLLVQYMIWVLMVPALTIIIVLLYSHFEQKKLLAELEAQKAQTELNFLKAQLHPHFLFNTLNNLYALSVQGSPQTKTVAQGLRKLLSHIFDKSGDKVIPLSQELELVDTYVSLESLRYGDRLKHVHKVNLPSEPLYIVPMVLLSIVENAFKHGVSGDLGTPYISLDIHHTESHVRFVIENSVTEAVTTDHDDYTKGLGIRNIKRQLDLIYGDSCTYEIVSNADYYRVTLTITLESLIVKEQSVELMQTA